METYEVGSFWDNVGRQVDQRSDDGESTIASDDTPHYSHRQSRFFEEFLDPAFETAASVLEVGPGPGGNLNRLRSQGKTVFGADVSKVMMGVAHQNGLDCVVHIDGSHLPFENQFCDAVFTSTVLQHNTKERATSLLAEMARVAAKEVHLFEDTAPILFRDRRSHWLRRPSWYVSEMQSHGYELTYQRRLPLACQEVAAVTARVLVDGQRAQGAPPSVRRLRLEDALLRVAKPVDRHIPPLLGLTHMSFRRIGS